MKNNLFEPTTLLALLPENLNKEIFESDSAKEILNKLAAMAFQGNQAAITALLKIYFNVAVQTPVFQADHLYNLCTVVNTWRRHNDWGHAQLWIRKELLTANVPGRSVEFVVLRAYIELEIFRDAHRNEEYEQWAKRAVEGRRTVPSAANMMICLAHIVTGVRSGILKSLTDNGYKPGTFPFVQLGVDVLN